MGEIRKVGETYYIEFYARGLMYSQIAGPDLTAAQKLLADIEAKIIGGEALTIVRDIDLAVFLDQFLTTTRTLYPFKTSQRFDAAAKHFSNFIKEKFQR